METIRFIPVLENSQDEWSGRIITVKSQGEPKGRRPITWIGMSHPISSYRVSGEQQEIEQKLQSKINSFYDHDDNSP